MLQLIIILLIISCYPAYIYNFIKYPVKEPNFYIIYDKVHMKNYIYYKNMNNTTRAKKLYGFKDKFNKNFKCPILFTKKDIDLSFDTPDEALEWLKNHIAEVYKKEKTRYVVNKVINENGNLLMKKED